MVGTGHYYFDEMRSSFKKLGSKSAFCAHETQYLQKKISATAPAAVQKKGT
jgi:hypothetical protein